MAQVDTQETTIGPDSYRVQMLDPLVAGDMLVDLTDIFGPSISILGASVLKAKNSKAALAQLMDGVGGDLDHLGDNMERAFMELFKRLDKQKQRDIIKTLSSVTEVKQGDNWPQLDTVYTLHFRGRLKAMYQWLYFAVKSQYTDFF